MRLLHDTLCSLHDKLCLLHDKLCLQAYMESLPEDIHSNPQQLGSLLYSCVTLADEEARMLHEAVPQSPFQVSSLAA